MILCLFVQSAFGCMGVHASLCESDTGKAGSTALSGEHDRGCDVLCAHCHGGCTHCALSTPRPVNLFTPLPTVLPIHAQSTSREAVQHPLLRPPALPV